MTTQPFSVTVENQPFSSIVIPMVTMTRGGSESTKVLLSYLGSYIGVPQGSILDVTSRLRKKGKLELGSVEVIRSSEVKAVLEALSVWDKKPGVIYRNVRNLSLATIDTVILILSSMKNEKAKEAAEALRKGPTTKSSLRLETDDCKLVIWPKCRPMDEKEEVFGYTVVGHVFSSKPIAGIEGLNEFVAEGATPGSFHRLLEMLVKRKPLSVVGTASQVLDNLSTF